MESGASVTLATVITNIGSVFEGMIGWMGSLLSFIQSNPLILIGFVISFGFVVVALIKRLLPN